MKLYLSFHLRYPGRLKQPALRPHSETGLKDEYKSSYLP